MNYGNPQSARELHILLDAANLQLDEDLAGDEIPARGLTPEELDVLTPQERYIVRHHRSFYTANPLHPTSAARERYVELIIAAARYRKAVCGKEAAASGGLKSVLLRAMRLGH